MQNTIDLIKRLELVNTELFNKFGAESYNVRCEIYDVIEHLKAIDNFDSTAIIGILTKRQQFDRNEINNITAGTFFIVTEDHERHKKESPNFAYDLTGIMLCPPNTYAERPALRSIYVEPNTYEKLGTVKELKELIQSSISHKIEL